MSFHFHTIHITCAHIVCSIYIHTCSRHYVLFRICFLFASMILPVRFQLQGSMLARVPGLGHFPWKVRTMQHVNVP